MSQWNIMSVQMLPHSFLRWWHISTGSGGKGHSAMISGQRCVCVCACHCARASLCVRLCDCAERINALCGKIKLHVQRRFQSSRNSSSRKERRKEGREKRKKKPEKKLKYAKEFRGSFFFSVCQDETICRTHHSNVFTALYSKIDHFI